MLPINLRELSRVKDLSTHVGLSFQQLLLSVCARRTASRLNHSCGFNMFKYITFTDGIFQAILRAIKSDIVIFTDTRALQHLLSSQAAKHRVVCIANVLKLRPSSSIARCTQASAQSDVLSKVKPLLKQRPYVLAIGTSPTCALRALELMRNRILRPSVCIVCPLGFVNSDVCKCQFTRPTAHCCMVRSPFGGAALAASMINAIL
ncbi:MAG: precorrin-8X methylmutase [Candidatus Hodgkinia cicadicola]